MTERDVRHLMRVHIETLFTHDGTGRMLRVNEPDGKPAPRAFIGRTANGSELRLRHDIDAHLTHELMSALSNEGPGDEFLDAPYGSLPYESILARVAPVERVWSGPAYAFPSESAAAPTAVAVTEANASLLEQYLPDWLGDVPFRQPFFATVIDGHAVSAAAAFGSATSHTKRVSKRRRISGVTAMRRRRCRRGRTRYARWDAYPSTAPRGRIRPPKRWRDAWDSCVMASDLHIT